MTRGPQPKPRARSRTGMSRGRHEAGDRISEALRDARISIQTCKAEDREYWQDIIDRNAAELEKWNRLRGK